MVTWVYLATSTWPLFIRASMALAPAIRCAGSKGPDTPGWMSGTST